MFASAVLMLSTCVATWQTYMCSCAAESPSAEASMEETTSKEQVQYVHCSLLC